MIKEKLAGMKITSQRGLKRAITKAWRSIGPDECKRLINAFPKRLRLIIKRKGERITGKRTAVK